MSGQRWDAMMVREYQDNQGQPRSFWTKIGAAFTNRDGSIGIQLDALPMDGRIVLQIPLSKEERQHRQQQRQGGGQGGGQRGGGGFGNRGGGRGGRGGGWGGQGGGQRGAQPMPAGNLFQQPGQQPQGFAAPQQAGYVPAGQQPQADQTEGWSGDLPGHGPHEQAGMPSEEFFGGSSEPEPDGYF